MRVPLIPCAALSVLLAACAQQTAAPAAQGLGGLYTLRSVQYGAGAQQSASGARVGSLLVSGIGPVDRGAGDRGATDGPVSVTLDDGVDPERTFTGTHTLSPDGRDVVTASRGGTLTCGGATFSRETLTLNFFGHAGAGGARSEDGSALPSPAYLAAGEVAHPVCANGQVAYHKSSFRNLYLSR